MIPRALANKKCISLMRPISQRYFGSAQEKAFPILQTPHVVEDELANKRSELANSDHLHTLFACQSGGGEKGYQKHVVVNKKIMARDRIRHILGKYLNGVSLVTLEFKFLLV